MPEQPPKSKRRQKSKLKERPKRTRRRCGHAGRGGECETQGRPTRAKGLALTVLARQPVTLSCSRPRLRARREALRSASTTRHRKGNMPIDPTDPEAIQVRAGGKVGGKIMVLQSTTCSISPSSFTLDCKLANLPKLVAIIVICLVAAGVYAGAVMFVSCLLGDFWISFKRFYCYNIGIKRRHCSMVHR